MGAMEEVTALLKHQPAMKVSLTGYASLEEVDRQADMRSYGRRVDVGVE